MVSADIQDFRQTISIGRSYRFESGSLGMARWLYRIFGMEALLLDLPHTQDSREEILVTNA